MASIRYGTIFVVPNQFQQGYVRFVPPSRACCHSTHAARVYFDRRHGRGCRNVGVWTAGTMSNS